MKKYLIYFLERILIAFSLALNGLILWGRPIQTTSARAYIEDKKILRPLIDRLFFWEKEHCKKAWEWEVAHAKYTISLEEKRQKDKVG